MSLRIAKSLSEPGDTRRPVRVRMLAVLVAAVLLVFAGAFTASAREILDATGRKVTVPDQPMRVFAAGPPASVLLYALKPEAMIGWVRAPRDRDLPYLQTATHALPELGRLSGKGGTLNLEVLLAAKPDLIVDFGTVNETYLTLATKVQEQTGVPYVLIDGSFANRPAAIRQMAEILGVPERGEALASYAEATFAMVTRVLEAVPPEDRPTVYLARGPEGLESAARGAINAEIIDWAGGLNVVGGPDRGLVTTSVEQILAWAPATVVTIDRDFARDVATLPGWSDVPAVRDARVLLAPAEPFGFIDSPPSVNRLIGLHWLMHSFYPEVAEGDLGAEVARFYKLFYHVTLDDAAVAGLLEN
ncbi:iron complex transport system substrate-binding protein [Gemmobacter caeni]|uniref:Iron complex transport system substrate-binding protein n=1 Tax=Gemmobacter caeni TaxID=589035 RepID=A0A2T6AWP9_9RHOB|nr:ABC transporter substrate-binding protein [Gemmobacter caeni]PTX48244.1 iron complex transport system substrate-binding protein [Gemmobacter caeni]TWI96890.1 iron complex transport system substrate-binding protein [Gemmobacter caeni]